MPSARFKGVVALMSVLTVATFVAEPFLISQAPPPRPQAPDFTLPTVDGSTFRLSARPNRSLAIVEFMATWCFPCRNQIRDLAEIRAAFPAAMLTIVSVDEEYAIAPDRVIEFRSTFGAVQKSAEADGWYFAVDTVEAHVGLLYGASGLPTVVLVDGSGAIAKTWMGAVSAATMRAAITAEMRA